MKKYFPIIFLVLILYLNVNINLQAQFEKVDEISLWGYSLNAPIEMDVRESNDRIEFSVMNKSYFPYEFVIRFDEFQNLYPRIMERQAILYPGRTKLFTLNIADQNKPCQYKYSIRYVMGRPDILADINFPYIVPIGEGKVVKFEQSTRHGNPVFLLNSFKLSKGETVFAVRKGQVTALPDKQTDVDRISNESSLEVRHKDGTIAVYSGLNPTLCELKLGQSRIPKSGYRSNGKFRNSSINYL